MRIWVVTAAVCQEGIHEVEAREDEGREGIWWWGKGGSRPIRRAIEVPGADPRRNDVAFRRREDAVSAAEVMRIRNARFATMRGRSARAAELDAMDFNRSLRG